MATVTTCDICRDPMPGGKDTLFFGDTSCGDVCGRCRDVLGGRFQAWLTLSREAARVLPITVQR